MLLQQESHAITGKPCDAAVIFNPYVRNTIRIHGGRTLSYLLNL